MKYILFSLVLIATHPQLKSQTYAEKLGYPAGTKLLILHVDVICLKRIIHVKMK
jgi:hypothetical protein